MGSWGSSNGSTVVKDREIHKAVAWPAISAVPCRRRRGYLERALRAAKVRWPEHKAKYLAANACRIERDGGPAAVKRQLMGCDGREAKIEFLGTFKGIGAEYARNMMMDVYHCDFRESIAIDSRIMKISRLLGIEKVSYPEAEQFYLEAAHRAGLNGWTMDRLMYGYTEMVVDALNETESSENDA